MSTVLPGNLVRHTEFPHSVATEETTLRKNSWELWPPTFCDVVAMLYDNIILSTTTVFRPTSAADSIRVVTTRPMRCVLGVICIRPERCIHTLPERIPFHLDRSNDVGNRRRVNRCRLTWIRIEIENKWRIVLPHGPKRSMRIVPATTAFFTESDPMRFPLAHPHGGDHICTRSGRLKAAVRMEERGVTF